MHVRCSTRCSIVFALTMAAACGGGGGTGPSGDGNGDGGGGGGGGGRVVLDDPAFAANIQEIFDRRGCNASSCHGSIQEAGLDLRSGSSHASLVNVQATSEPILRVIPGNANGSYLVIKLEGRQSVGERMPRGQNPLDATDLANIKNWINNGAPNN